MDFLTKRTQFQCVASPLVKFKISASGKVEHKNSTVLTTSTKLSGSGTCSILTAMAQGVRQPCQFQQTQWLLSDSTRKANGENLLTDKSFCNCSQCPSVIKVRAALAFGFQSGNFSAQTAPAIAALPPLDNENKTIKNDNQAMGYKLQATSCNLQADNKQENEVIDAKNTEKENVAESTENLQYSLKCLTCTKKNCQYRLDAFKDFSDKVIKKGSKALFKNYQKYLDVTDNFNEADNAYRKSEELKGGWAYASHHIIPAIQVFAKFPELVKVANACGYDINCAENLIELPRVYEEDEPDDKSKKDKSHLAVEVMAVIGMQWHAGGHNYPTKDEELVRLVQSHMGRRRRVEIKNYVELVTEDVRKIKIPADGIICPEKIIMSINKVSAKVRKKLAAFKEDPKASYPYYVSRKAYFFAFKASRFNRFTAWGRGGLRLIHRRITKFISD